MGSEMRRARADRQPADESQEAKTMKNLIAVGVLTASMAMSIIGGGVRQADAGLRYRTWAVPDNPNAYFKLDKWTGKQYLCVIIPLQPDDCTDVTTPVPASSPSAPPVRTHHFAVIHSQPNGNFPEIAMEDDVSADAARIGWETYPISEHVIAVIEVQPLHPYEIDICPDPRYCRPGTDAFLRSLEHHRIAFQARDDTQALKILLQIPRPIWSLTRRDTGATVVHGGQWIITTPDGHLSVVDALPNPLPTGTRVVWH
jgi:hypothetical protein